MNYFDEDNYSEGCGCLLAIAFVLFFFGPNDSSYVAILMIIFVVIGIYYLLYPKIYEKRKVEEDKKQWEKRQAELAQQEEQERIKREKERQEAALAFGQRVRAAEPKLNEILQKSSPYKLPKYLQNWCFTEDLENYQAINSLNFANNIGLLLNKEHIKTRSVTNRYRGIALINDAMIDYKYDIACINFYSRQIGGFPNQQIVSFHDQLIEKKLNELVSNAVIPHIIGKDEAKSIINDITGDYGEMEVARCLVNENGSSSAYLLTDVVLPFSFGEGENNIVQIDGIYISHHGIYSIEVKTRGNLKSVKMSNDGQLIINGHKEEATNSLLQQINIHHSAIRILLENSKNPQIKQMIKNLHGRVPIQNVVAIVSNDGNADFSIDLDSFKKHDVNVTGLPDLYNTVASGMHGSYIGDQQIVQLIYKVFEDNGSFNIFNSITDVKHHGKLKSKQYKHTVFFDGCDWSGSKPNLRGQEEVIHDIENFKKEMARVHQISNILKKAIGNYDPTQYTM